MQEYSRRRTKFWLPGLDWYSINLLFIVLRPFFVDDGKAGGAWKMRLHFSVIEKNIPILYRTKSRKKLGLDEQIAFFSEVN